MELIVVAQQKPNIKLRIMWYVLMAENTFYYQQMYNTYVSVSPIASNPKSH